MVCGGFVKSYFMHVEFRFLPYRLHNHKLAKFRKLCLDTRVNVLTLSFDTLMDILVKKHSYLT